jgi:predicted ATPase
VAVPALPTGTVTFLFTDVEGSTSLLDKLGAEGYAGVLADHRRVVRDALEAHAGVEVDTQGDAFFAAFSEAPAALAAAAEMHERLAGGPLAIRIGIHTGTGLVADGGYVGMDVHRAARIAAAARGGQTVVSSSTAALAEGAPLVDLGEHRFKDLAAAERVFQSGPGTFPVLRTLGRNNLPVPATPFLGRASELAQAAELAGRAGVRVVTFTGPGGTGKTRLALQVAAELSGERVHGTFWVPLAAVRDPALVLAGIGDVLGVAGEEAWSGDAVVAALDGKQVVLLLDNVEHLLPDVAPTIARLVSVVGPTVLVTSRERLRLQQEHLFPVPAMVHDDAEELFVARARQLDPGFRVSPAVGELCRRLDDLPLALELAAARTSLFSTEQLLARLGDRLDLLRGGRDADPRQQTLRATMEWSHDLLDDGEQRLFARLTTFVSGCTFEAAETVCDADPESLQGLLDKSFLRRRETEAGPRFWMLGTIRDYGVERLATLPSELEQMHERHAAWCLSLLADLPDHSIGPTYEQGRAVLTAERAELVSALAWARDRGHDELFLRLGSPLGGLWLSLFLVEAPTWLEHAERVLVRAPADVRAAALRTCGAIAFFVLADTPRAVAFWERALDDAIEIGDDRLAYFVRYRLAMAVWDSGNPAASVKFLERAVEDARRDGDSVQQVMALHHLGEVMRDLREYDRGEALLGESLALSRAIGDKQMADQTTHSLGDLELDRGRFEQAGRYYADSMRIALGNADPRGMTYCLAGIASVLLGLGHTEDAAAFWAAAEAAEHKTGFRMLASERVRYARLLDPLKTAPAWPDEEPLPLDDAAERALASID